jgi:hypothetical protein
LGGVDGGIAARLAASCDLLFALCGLLRIVADWRDKRVELAHGDK